MRVEGRSENKYRMDGKRKRREENLLEQRTARGLEESKVVEGN